MTLGFNIPIIHLCKLMKNIFFKKSSAQAKGFYSLAAQGNKYDDSDI